MPRLFDPGEPPTPGHFRASDVVFRWINGVDFASALSRLNHAACTLSVYASQPGSPPDHATLDSGWWSALTGQDSHLLGRIEGFRHVYPSTWLPPPPSFAWRNNPTNKPCDDALHERQPDGRGFARCRKTDPLIEWSMRLRAAVDARNAYGPQVKLGVVIRHLARFKQSAITEGSREDD